MNYIHIGLPKCASTSLQENLFSAHPDIQYWGRPWLDGEILSLMACLRQHDALDFEKVNKSLDLSQDKPNVISHERFSSDFNADRSETARRLKEVFGESEILLVIRNQADQMESLYKQYLRGVPGKRPWCTFEEYLEACYCLFHWQNPAMRSRYKEDFSHVATMNRLSMLKTDDLAGLYARYFGREHVHVFVFEELKRNLPGFVDKLCSIIPMDAEKALALMERPKKQVSMDTAAYLTKGPWAPLGRLAPGPVKRLIKGRLGGLNTKMEVRWPLGWREKIEDVYRQTNRNLAAEFGLPLNDYGYPL